MVVVSDKLKYINNIFNVECYDTGMKVYKGIDEAYLNSKINKVIIKLDLMYYFNDWFEQSHIDEYKDAILIIAKGLLREPKTFSEAIGFFVDNDKVFKKKIQELWGSCYWDSTFGDYIIDMFAKVITDKEEYYKEYFRGRSEFVICVSDSYMYFSIPDEKEYILRLPNDIKYEVITNVKDWKGTVIRE